MFTDRTTFERLERQGKPLRQDLSVKSLTSDDLTSAANIHSLAFPRQRLSAEWIAAKIRAFPATYCYGARQSTTLLGAIIWTHKSGFRERAVLELEQIFVHPDHHHQGIGRTLIVRSLEQVNRIIEAKGFSIGTICVNTRTDNNAMGLYISTLGVRKVCEIEGHTPGATEVFLAATDISISSIVGSYPHSTS